MFLESPEQSRSFHLLFLNAAKWMHRDLHWNWMSVPNLPKIRYHILYRQSNWNLPHCARHVNQSNMFPVNCVLDKSTQTQHGRFGSGSMLNECRIGLESVIPHRAMRSRHRDEKVLCSVITFWACDIRPVSDVVDMSLFGLIEHGEQLCTCWKGTRGLGICRHSLQQ